MRTGIRITTLMMAAVVLVGPAHAQAPGSSLASQYIDEASGLALDAAIAGALEREPALRAVRSGVAVAEAMQRQAGLRSNPTLTLERRDEPRGTDSLTEIGVEWPLDLFRRSARVRTAERTLEATRLGVFDRERTLIAEVRGQYGAAATSIREVLVADNLLAAARQQWDVLRARVDVGGAPPLERDLLDVERRRLEAELLLAEGSADIALVQLKRLLGMHPEAPLRLRDTIEALVAGNAVGASPRSGSLSARPDVREAEARVRLADAQVEQARREGRLDVSLFGTYMRMDSGFPQEGVGRAGALERVRGRFTYVAGGAMVMVPLFNRNQGQVAAAQAERSGAQARRVAAELAAHAEVAEAQVREEKARRALALYTGGIRKLAGQNLDVVRQTFELGRATVSDVLAEQRRYLDVEQAYTNALREAWEARTNLQRAVGEAK